MVPELLRFPSVEVEHPADEHEFPNPLVGLRLPWSRYGESVHVPRGTVDRLLSGLEGDEPGRGWVLTTLGFLQAWGALTEDESIRVSAAMWDELDGTELPNVRGFGVSDFAQFPHPDYVDADGTVRMHLLRAVESEPPGSRWYEALSEIGKSVGAVDWEESDAGRLMTRVKAWWEENKGRLDDKTLTPFGTLADTTSAKTSTLVNVLSALLFDVGQRVRDEGFSEAMAKNFVDFVSDLRNMGIYATRLEVAGLGMLPDVRVDIIGRVTSGLLHEDAACVADAIEAIRMLVARVADERKQPASGVVQVSELGIVVRRLAQGVEWRHAPALASRLRAAAEIIRTAGWAFSDEDREALVEGLDRLGEETSNGVIGNDDTGVILVRAAAGSLASALHWRYRTSEVTVPRALAEWKALCDSEDEFAEVRNSWEDEGEA